jgi:hypothetical protein
MAIRPFRYLHNQGQADPLRPFSDISVSTAYDFGKVISFVIIYEIDSFVTA